MRTCPGWIFLRNFGAFFSTVCFTFFTLFLGKIQWQTGGFVLFHLSNKGLTVVPKNNTSKASHSLIPPKICWPWRFLLRRNNVCFRIESNTIKKHNNIICKTCHVHHSCFKSFKFNISFSKHCPFLPESLLRKSLNISTPPYVLLFDYYTVLIFPPIERCNSTPCQVACCKIFFCLVRCWPAWPISLKEFSIPESQTNGPLPPLSQDDADQQLLFRRNLDMMAIPIRWSPQLIKLAFKSSPFGAGFWNQTLLMMVIVKLWLFELWWAMIFHTNFWNAWWILESSLVKPQSKGWHHEIHAVFHPEGMKNSGSRF